MSRNFMKKTLAGIFALVIVVSSTPIAPFVPVMNSNSITASAETASETDFGFDASSGTITQYTGTGGDVEIPSKIGGVAVTSIGSSAFKSCSNLASVTIPEGVTSIGNCAFSDCSSLVSVTIPEGVTSIGVYAFAGCSSLTSVTIPEGVTSIGEGAFQFCYDLTSVTIPESVTSIDSYAFSDCESLASVTIPESVTSIGVGAFAGCSSLASVTIPEGVTSIGVDAFAGCSSLTSVTIPEGVTSIGDYAFDYCASLTSITIPKSVTSIGVSAFSGCSSLTSITAPCALENSMSDAMGNCLAEITYTHPGANREGDTYTVKCACGDKEIDYAAIFTLLADEEDFLNNMNPDDYTEDSWNAWDASAKALAEIANDFQENKFVSSQDELTAAISAYNTAKTALVLKDAENFEFDASSGTITKYTGAGGDVEIPSKIGGVAVTSIGVFAFQDCQNLASVTIPEGVTSIGECAFFGCEGLVSVTIPESVTSIGMGAFAYCSKLASVTIPEGVTSIGESAFEECYDLTSVTIPESVTSIGDYAFMKCSSLASVTIPESVTSIGGNVFAYCSKLTSVTIPESVTSIGDSAFLSCSSLASVTIPESVTSIGWNVFAYCSKLTSVTIPESVTSIGGYVFAYCSNLTSVTIPESVTSIGDYAFMKCSNLTSVTIPEDVTSIGEGAFLSCSSLASVTAPCTLKNSMSGAMDDCPAEITYMHPCTIREGDTYKVKCACGDKEIDYTDIFTLLSDEEDFLNNVNPNDYTEDSWKALDDSATALAEIANDFQENKFVSSQNELTAALSAYNIAKDALELNLSDADYTAVDAAIANIPDDLSIYTDASVDALIAAYNNVVRDLKEDKQSDVDAMAAAIEDAIDALEEKPQYDTLYECYLVTAPTVTETGTYNKRAYHYENDAKVVDTEKVFAEDKAVTFEQWYLRTLIQYQTNGTEFDLRFVSMLDENLDQYQKAGFIFTINGTAVPDELSTVTANTSYIVDGKEVKINAFSEDDDYFFLQNYVFDIGEIDLDATLAVTAYVVLADGKELQGTKAVTFTLRQFEG